MKMAPAGLALPVLGSDTLHSADNDRALGYAVRKMLAGVQERAADGYPVNIQFRVWSRGVAASTALDLDEVALNRGNLDGMIQEKLEFLDLVIGAFHRSRMLDLGGV